jgi:hypothetical protein
MSEGQTIIDTEDLNWKLEEVHKKDSKYINKRVVEWNEKLALYFHYASTLLTKLLSFGEDFLGVQIAQTILSTGLESVAIANTIAEAKEAYKQKQYGAFAAYMMMIPIMTASKIESEARKYIIKVQQDEAKAMQQEVARYSI